MGFKESLARIRESQGEGSPHEADLKVLESGHSALILANEEKDIIIADDKRNISFLKEETIGRRKKIGTLETENSTLTTRLTEAEAKFPDLQEKLGKMETWQKEQAAKAKTNWEAKLETLKKHKGFETVKANFIFAQEGAELTDADIQSNNAKYAEYQKIGIFEPSKKLEIDPAHPGAALDGDYGGYKTRAEFAAKDPKKFGEWRDAQRSSGHSTGTVRLPEGYQK